MTTTFPFRINAIVTRDRIAAALEPEFRVTGTWDDRGEEAVHVTNAGRPMGSGVYVADGQQLIVEDDGSLHVEEISRV